ncbi:MAG: hypothetical protein ABWZ25_18095 [Chitinophagaceae bacterium]
MRGKFLNFEFPSRKECISGIVIDYNDEWTWVRRCFDYMLDSYTIFKNHKVVFEFGEYERRATIFISLLFFSLITHAQRTKFVRNDSIHKIDKLIGRIESDSSLFKLSDTSLLEPINEDRFWETMEIFDFYIDSTNNLVKAVYVSINLGPCTFYYNEGRLIKAILVGSGTNLKVEQYFIQGNQKLDKLPARKIAQLSQAIFEDLNNLGMDMLRRYQKIMALRRAQQGFDKNLNALALPVK